MHIPNSNLIEFTRLRTELILNSTHVFTSPSHVISPMQKEQNQEKLFLSLTEFTSITQIAIQIKHFQGIIAIKCFRVNVYIKLGTKKNNKNKRKQLAKQANILANQSLHIANAFRLCCLQSPSPFTPYMLYTLPSLPRCQNFVRNQSTHTKPLSPIRPRPDANNHVTVLSYPQFGEKQLEFVTTDCGLET